MEPDLNRYDLEHVCADHPNMSREKFWETYQLAWETRDAERAASLFTEDATYYETPFGEPAKGRDGVRDYWAAATRDQSGVRFTFQVLALSEQRGIARWWAEFTGVQTGIRAELDGMFLLEFEQNGLCRSLREWWHGREVGTQEN